MSYWVIKYGSYTLSDFRPQVECPQWYYDRARWIRFGTAAAAHAAWRAQVAKHPGLSPFEDVRVVRVTTRKDRQERLEKLHAAMTEAVGNLPMNPNHARNVLSVAISTTPWPRFSPSNGNGQETG